MKLLKLNHYQQMTEYTCGPATLLTFLDYHDKKAFNKLTEKRLSKLLKTCPNIGTTPQNIYKFLREAGQNVELVKNMTLYDLEQNVNVEKPAIVLWCSDDEWHWSTHVGYDNENIILIDPEIQDGLRYINKREFDDLWTGLIIK